jgi:hypothetical protein
MKGAALVLALTACGARTELGAPERFDASVPDVAHDVAQPEDVIVTDSGCASDAQCDDGIACTMDVCDPALRVCTHAPRSALCDDGVFCDGDEVCDPSAGCTTIPRDCADSVSCTVDTCDEQNKTCVHAPDDSLCPISHVCDPVLGCQAHALAHDDTTLYDVRLPSGQVNVIGSTGAQLTDIALSPSNVLFGLGFGALYTVSQQTGLATFAKNVNGSSLNGADVAPNGTLWVSGGSALSTLDTTSGALAFVASFPNGTSSSGDLAWVGSRLLATATTGGGDDLVEFDVLNKTSKVLGATGFTCIWGLAAYGTTLYGLTCQGLVLSIDTTTGKATQLNKSSATFWGASAR